MSSDPEKDLLRAFFEQLTYEQIDNIIRALKEGKDEYDLGDDEDGLDDDGEDIDFDEESLVQEFGSIYEQAKAAISGLPPEKQEELADELLMKRAARREWLGDEDDGYNQVPTAVLYGLSPESDAGERVVIHHRAWHDTIELALRRKAFSFDESESIHRREEGIRDAKRCKEAAARLLKWCAKFSDNDTVAFGSNEVKDLPEFKHYRALAADEEPDSDWCHVHVASVKKFAEFLDHCGGFRFP
jgi:hypothetical protein